MKRIHSVLVAIAMLTVSPLCIAGSDAGGKLPTLKLGVQENVIAEMEIADPDDGGSITRIRLTAETSSLAGTVNLGPNDILPAKIVAKWESQVHGDVEQTIELAEIALGRYTNVGDGGSLNLDFVQFKYQELDANDQEQLGYSEVQTLNLITASIEQLIAKKKIPWTSIPVAISIEGGIDFGAGKSDAEDAETDAIFTYTACVRGDIQPEGKKVVSKLCGTYVDADVFGTGDSGVDSTATVSWENGLKLDKLPVHFTAGIVGTDYGDQNPDAENRVEARVGVRWKFGRTK